MCALRCLAFARCPVFEVRLHRSTHRYSAPFRGRLLFRCVAAPREQLRGRLGGFHPLLVGHSAAGKFVHKYLFGRLFSPVLGVCLLMEVLGHVAILFNSSRSLEPSMESLTICQLLVRAELFSGCFQMNEISRPLALPLC